MKNGLSKEEAYAAALKKKKIATTIAITAGVTVAVLGAYAAYKHFNNPLTRDFVLRKGLNIQTISKFKNRYEMGDHVYAAFKNIDKSRYVADWGKEGFDYKYKINAILKKSSKMASADSSSKIFANLYSKNDQFKKAVDLRLSSWGTKTGLEHLKSSSLDDKYRQFVLGLAERDFDLKSRKYVVPSEYKTFFKEMKNRGYHGMIDINDVAGSGSIKRVRGDVISEIWGFGTKKPVIFFDADDFKNVSVKQLTDPAIRRAGLKNFAYDIIKDTLSENKVKLAGLSSGLATFPIMYYATYDQSVINQRKGKTK